MREEGVIPGFGGSHDHQCFPLLYSISILPKGGADSSPTTGLPWVLSPFLRHFCLVISIPGVSFRVLDVLLCPFTHWGSSCFCRYSLICQCLFEFHFCSRGEKKMLSTHKRNIFTTILQMNAKLIFLKLNNFCPWKLQISNISGMLKLPKLLTIILHLVRANSCHEVIYTIIQNENKNIKFELYYSTMTIIKDI